MLAGAAAVAGLTRLALPATARGGHSDEEILWRHCPFAGLG
jgi:hypothetical protein